MPDTDVAAPTIATVQGIVDGPSGREQTLTGLQVNLDLRPVASPSPPAGRMPDRQAEAQENWRIIGEIPRIFSLRSRG